MNPTWTLKVALSEIANQARPPNFAYVSALWGDAVNNLALGMALGHSIAASGTTLPRYLLHTHDVPREYLTILQRWWTLKLVPCPFCRLLALLPVARVRFVGS